MKKSILFALISAFVFSLSVSAEVNEKEVKKLAKKEAKTLKKERWQVAPGALPLQTQLEESYRKQLDKNEVGLPKFFVGSAQPVSEFYDAAKIQAQSLARFDIVSQIQTEMKGLIETAVGNKMLSNDEAASINQVIMKSTEKIAGKLGRTSPLVECFQKLPNGNTRVMIRIAYPSTRALEEAKGVVREQLEAELKELAEKLDRISVK